MWKFLVNKNRLCPCTAWALFICSRVFHNLQTIDEVPTLFFVKLKLSYMKQLLFLFALFTISVNAQRIQFNYDTAGNQTRRFICLSCSARIADSIPKEIAELKEEDLLKFSPEDIISYYPNPVREELYLKWELINENKVTSIEVFSINGQRVNLYANLEKENTKNIPFQEYPQGTYLVLLNYTNGEQKSITILKQ